MASGVEIHCLKDHCFNLLAGQAGYSFYVDLDTPRPTPLLR